MYTINKASFFVSVVSNFSWLFHMFHFAMSLIINVLCLRCMYGGVDASKVLP